MAYTHRYKNGIRVELTAEEITALENQDTITANAAPSDLELSLIILRRTRNNLLIKTDWLANSDVTMSDDWKTYRQALRDLPSGLDTVEKVNAKEFPTKPLESE